MADAKLFPALKRPNMDPLFFFKSLNIRENNAVLYRGYRLPKDINNKTVRKLKLIFIKSKYPTKATKKPLRAIEIKI